MFLGSGVIVSLVVTIDNCHFSTFILIGQLLYPIGKTQLQLALIGQLPHQSIGLVRQLTSQHKLITPAQDLLLCLMVHTVGVI